MRTDLSKKFKELQKNGEMKGKKAGPDFINPKVKAFRAERECLKESGIAAILTEEFIKDLEERLKDFKRIADLKPVTKDAL